LIKINLILIIFILMTIQAQTEQMMVPKKKPTPLDSPKSKFVSDIQIYNYLTNEKKLDRNKTLGILANIQAESNFEIGVTEKSDAVNKGLGLFQYTFPTRKEGLLKKVPDYKTNWKGQIDYFLSEPEAKSYLKENFDNASKAAEFLMQKNLRPANELRPLRTKKHDEYISKFEKKF
tara:strand:+ start:273 stop:800 length:528 start_codon:yes stop_codon:yes gene_type:complete